MDVTPLLRSTQKIIQSYTTGRFKISGEVFEGGVIIGSDFVEQWAGYAFDEPSQFSHLKDKCDVLLIGTGKNTKFLTPAQRQIYREAGFHVDVMDTGAACRTFNVLSAEGRQVIAALIPV